MKRGLPLLVAVWAIILPLDAVDRATLSPERVWPQHSTLVLRGGAVTSELQAPPAINLHGAAIVQKRSRSKPSVPPVWEREKRSAGQAECKVCRGMTDETTRCPRCLQTQPALHALCEEEWLLRNGFCMFCRLPVRRVEKKSGGHGEAGQAFWSYRSNVNKEYTTKLSELRKDLQASKKKNQGAKVSKQDVRRSRETPVRANHRKAEPRPRKQLEMWWREHQRLEGPSGLDEISVCATLELAASMFEHGSPAHWVWKVIETVESMVHLMEGRTIAQALKALADLGIRFNCGSRNADTAILALTHRAAHPHIQDTFTGQILATAIISASRLALDATNEMVQSLSTRTQEKGSLNGVSGPVLVGILESWVTMNLQGFQVGGALGALSEALSEQRVLHSLGPQEITTVCEALESLGYKNEWLLVRLAARIMEDPVRENLRGRHIASIASSYAALRQSDRALFEALEQKALEKSILLATANFDAARILKAYTEMGFSSSNLQDALRPIAATAQEFETRMDVGSATPSD